jgi:hypothetical protein
MKATIDTQPFLQLPTSEDFFLFPEDNDGTIPLDPTNQQHLRSMSPFVLTIDAPFMGDYVKSGKRKPFSGARYSSPGMAGIRSYEDLKYSPRIPTFAKSPIRGGRINGLEARVDAGLVDRDQLISIATQDRQIRATPPIVFLINPTTMGFSYESVQNFSESTRYGFIFYRWGEQIVKIQISCTIGAFIAGRARREIVDVNGNVSGLTGLQFASRRDSAGWRQLMNILAVYRNSAAIRDVLGRSRANHAVGTQSIYYDGQRWTGRITSLSFSVGEAQQNGGIEFSMDFEVYKHTQEGFETRNFLLPMHEPTPNLFNTKKSVLEKDASQDSREDYDFEV